MNHQEALASAPRRGATSAHRTGLGARLALGGALLLALATLGAPAHAQYVWIDEKGLKQFSDRPPSASIPAKNILKAPGKMQLQQAEDNADAPKDDADAPAKKAKAPPTLAERNADFDKRRTAAAEQDKKTAEEAKRKSDLAANCQAARTAKQTLDSGMRMRTMDANGQPTFMSDAERAQRSQKIASDLTNCN